MVLGRPTDLASENRRRVGVLRLNDQVSILVRSGAHLPTNIEEAT